MRKSFYKFLGIALSAGILFSEVTQFHVYGADMSGKISETVLETEEPGPDIKGYFPEKPQQKEIQVQAASDIKWKYSQGILSISGKGEMPDYSSGAPWYSQYSSVITDVKIGEGITGIGKGAFYGCTRLTDVSLPKTLKKVGEGAFADCYSLEKLTLPDAVTEIGNYAFQQTAISEIVLPASLSNISGLAFFGGNLIDIRVASGNKTFYSKNGVLFSKNKKILYLYPARKSAESYTVPANVEQIGNYAFIKANIRSVVLPDKLKKIGESAFQQSWITSLSLPDSVTSVGDFFCYGCDELKKVSIGKKLTKLSYQAFRGCTALTSVELGKVKDLDYLAFAECTALKKIVIPKGVKSIKNGSFGNCSSLKSVTIPDTVTEIAYQAFLGCKSLTKIKLPAKLKAIYRQAFWGTSLKTVNIPKTVVEIGQNAFPSDTKLKNINSSLVKIDDGAYVLAAKVKIKVKESYAKSFQVLKEVNKERKKQGMAALKMDKNLLEAAMLRAAETCIYWSHTRPNGQDCFTASGLMSAENIAVGSYTASSVMSQWMNSPGHKANILGNYKSIGIGCVEMGGICYWVQCFGSGSASQAKASSYKDNRNRNRIINVKADKEYYHPIVELSASKVKVGKTAAVQVYWDNGFVRIQIPQENLKYKSTNTSVCTVSKGRIKGKKKGTAKIKVWFPGYEKGAVTKKITITK